MTDLHRLRFVAVADVYKAGRLAGRLERTGDAGTAFRYDPAYLEVGHPPVAVTLPLTGDPVAAPSGGVPPFFAGLLPEGHRLTVLKDAVKTSLDDELSLLLAVGADAPGDVQIVPSGEPPIEPEPLAGFTKPQELDFTVLAAAVDLHAKNVSVLGGPRRGFAVAPVYDVPCTLLYDDDSQALPVDGRVKNLRPRHWAAFADAIGLPERAAQAANTLALRAAAAVDLRALPFEGSPLNRAERELRYRRAQLET